MSAELVLSDVTKTYDGRAHVLRGVSLSVRPGETVSIVGPSGSGKSTLLNIIGSLDRPTSGSVQLGDVDVAALEGGPLAAFRALEVGFIFQDHHLLPQLTAIENVLLPSLAARRGDALPKARELLGRVGLLDHADSLPAQMSGGERQRVAVARAMINNPTLLLCDEPTGNLDRDAGEGLVNLFLELARADGTTVVMVTHNLDFARRFERCIELQDGRVVDAASSREGPPG